MAFDQFGARRHVQLRQLRQGASTLKSWLIKCSEIEESPDGKELLGDSFLGRDTDLSVVNSSIRWVENVHTSKLPDPLKNVMVGGGDSARDQLLGASLSLISVQEHFLECCTAWTDFAQLTDSRWAATGEDVDLELVLQRDQAALTSLGSVEEMSVVCRAAKELEAAKLGPLTSIVAERGLDPNRAPIVFLAAFYRAAVRELFARYPEVRLFDGLSQDQIRSTFSQAEEDLQELHRANLAAKIANRSTPMGSGGSRVSDFTDLTLLKYQVQPNRRPLPIRKLLKQAGSALQALKPCFMMGPMSVAQFLDPAAMHFDLVIMDEASQLRPEDALGSIARSSQAVVVGDERQLPPTRFYQQQLADGGPNGDDDLVAAEAESILTLAKPIFRAQSLQWHYRSRHESLISFSNHHFYDDRLIIFPSPHRDDSKLGVSFEFIEDSRYSNSRNPPEALRVARAAVDHLLKNDGDTLGVVAMNYEQAELIESEIARLLRDNPLARRLEEQRENEAERWFAKNLENVQGDERDVIFISTTYGRSEAGAVSMQLGPITQSDGWRRLNVLFTRARKRIVVFAGMTDADMTIAPGGSRGSQALKDYLAFAREGVIFQPKFSKRPPDSDFEISVAKALRAHGYDCICQLGVANYFIDIAVVHPSQPGRYLLGIECDGRMYHSGKYARDRDRLRQMVLGSRLIRSTRL